MTARSSTGSRAATALDRHALGQVRELPVLLLSWLLAWPLGRLWRRDPGSVVVIGREDGQFSDNAKYFFIEGSRARDPRFTVVFVTGDTLTHDALRSRGAEVVLYPSLHAFRVLLGAGFVAVDSAEWVRGGRYQLLAGAKRVQLWHGVPLKAIELAALEWKLARMTLPLRLLYRAYLGIYARHPRYDVVVSTSRFFTGVAFTRSFDAKTVMESGYPRNDPLAIGHDASALERVNTDERAIARVRQFRNDGHRIVLYAPTFRTHGRNPFDGGVLDYAALQAFAARHRLCIVLKLHPLLSGAQLPDDLSHVIGYEARTDVYPVLRDVDVLVTDYSSIYFDFLLLDRPIVHFAYDLEDYLGRERQLLFEYREMTPGPVARTQEELERALLGVLDGPDTFAAERARVRGLAFDHPAGGAAGRVWQGLAGVAASRGEAA